MIEQEVTWLTALRRYAAASLALHLLWEILQLPLYTIWTTGTAGQRWFAVAHCTAGDVMIAALTLLLALAVAGSSRWPREAGAGVWLVAVVLGIGYTIFSEWLNIAVRASWAYSTAMPTMPLIGTGLSPLAQWLIVPTVAFRYALRHWPWQPRET